MSQYNINDFYPSTDAQVKSDGNIAYLENMQGILLQNQTRTTTTVSPDQTNYNAKGVIIFLDVTVSSGTGGLQVQLRTRDPQNYNDTYALNNLPTAITAVSRNMFIFYPGAASAGGSIVNTYQTVLPPKWFVQITHGDATNYNYSLSYALIL